jgi:hypothetical protein
MKNPVGDYRVNQFPDRVLERSRCLTQQMQHLFNSIFSGDLLVLPKATGCLSNWINLMQLPEMYRKAQDLAIATNKFRHIREGECRNAF